MTTMNATVPTVPVAAPPKARTTRTTPSFEIRAIAPGVLERLRVGDDAGRVREIFADPEGGAPLRCCLRRSRAGERIMLVSYAPLRAWALERGVDPGAYDEVGPVFVHGDPCGGPEGGGYPVGLHGSPRVLRAYDARGRIRGGVTVELPVERAGEVDGLLAEVFADPGVALVHVRAVVFGCFLAEARPLR
ncbi:DUF1203 domain-containing protein [Nocardiopsis changdeensis]|uniref:DUF1203 domain-containing protein n=1 Tax=Nocardiopsis changdeensis TaxID=2831969 RepID=A0ABX8BV39_9ACTN|nr:MULTISPECIES: DUF1203 domain-containing protein [Nocardiopsis]QUX24628.1 DUF1203 domain-containing protein [Nocardiopsis changdeensis]QYX35016.1 DUF1203 domain-containing protein [Nocardiopsis sp. MT53]